MKQSKAANIFSAGIVDNAPVPKKKIKKRGKTKKVEPTKGANFTFRLQI